MNCPSCQAPNHEGAEVCFACGKGIHALTQDALLGGRYKIRQALGSGGMGTVYLAHDQALDEEVAVKVLRPQFASSPEMTSRFRSEIKLARKVGHPNVCRIYEYGVDGQRHYISMELVSGVDLRRLVLERGGLPTEEAFDVAVQISQGLQAIHDAGIIHRDLKASNIMIDGSGVVRLMDFGIAKKSGGEHTAAATNMVMGTPEYMSPEQALGAGVDFRSDVYSLAVVIYEIFTGHVPFVGHTPAVTMFMHLKEPPPLDGTAASRLPPALVPLLRKGLSKEPAQRYATARGVAAELRKARAAGATASGGAQVPLDEEAAIATVTVSRLGLDSARAVDPGATPVEHARLAPTNVTARVDGWMQALKDPQAPVRWQAAAALWELGPRAAPAAPALRAALADSDPNVARAAGEALRRITGEEVESGVGRSSVSAAQDGSPSPALLAALENGDLRAREEASIALGSTKPPGPAVPALIQALKDNEPAVRAAAAAGLVQLGASLAAAGEPESSSNQAMIARLVAALGEALKDQAVVVRRRAARGLAELGPSSRPAVPALLEALQDADVSVAHTAASALEAIVGIRRSSGPPTESPPAAPSVSPTVSTLVSGLKHDDPSVRWRAAVALGASGVAARPAVPALVDLLDDETDIIRWEAAKALGKMGEAAGEAVPALAATLHGQQDGIVRRSAAEALGRIGAGAREGVPALIAALKDADAAVAGASEEALLRIGREAVPALIEAVNDDDAQVRGKAAELVTRIGTDWAAKQAAPAAGAPEPEAPWAGKRRSARLDVGVTLRLRRLQTRGAESSEELTVTENLSEGGAKVVTSLPVEKGEIVELLEQEGPLRIRALVINVSIGPDNRPRLHLQFFEVDDASRLQGLLAQGDPLERAR